MITNVESHKIMPKHIKNGWVKQIRLGKKTKLAWEIISTNYVYNILIKVCPHYVDDQHDIYNLPKYV